MRPTAAISHKPNLEAAINLAALVKLKRVKVGVPKGPGAKPKKVRTKAGVKDVAALTLATVAAAHEYGAPEANVPERPFLRNTLKANLPKYKRLNVANVRKVIRSRMKEGVALGQLGAVAAGDVQRFIRNNPYDIKQETKDRKGSSKPLIDTGQLVQSITYEVGK